MRFDAATDASTTLEKLVRTENEGGSRVATACLIRLIRCVSCWFRLIYISYADFFVCSGLALTCSALMHLQKDRDAELHTCFRRSYDEVLKHHHSYFVQTVVIVSPCLPRFLLIVLTHLDDARLLFGQCLIVMISTSVWPKVVR